MNVEASAPFEATFDSGTSGLVGTVQVKVIDNDGVTVIGPTTTNIAEDGTSGIYIWNAPAAPADLGQYTIVWSRSAAFDPEDVGIEDLVVYASTTGVLPPIPPPDDSGLQVGPCTAWTTGDDVAACCSADDESSDTTLLDEVAIQASQILYEITGRLYPGLCQKTVRPCRTGCGCNFQVLSRGHIVWNASPWGWGGDSWYCGGNPCGCTPLSRVKLSGYPVREVTEVKIDGDVVNPDTYRLDEHRFLTRVRDPADPDTVLLWPACQVLDLDDDQDGTFSVTYTYGASPPALGIRAAAALACELYSDCTTGECKLPSGATRIIRQGLTIERLQPLAVMLLDGSTGVPAIDSFIAAYNPNQIKRRPSIWSPGSNRYARPVGT